MRTSTRLWIAIALGAAILAIAGLCAWFLWIPSLVRGRVEEAAQRRGLEAVVGGVSLGWTDVVLTDVALRDSAGALSIAVASVSTGAGPFALASDGTAAIEHLEVGRVRLTVGLDAPELPGALAALRGGDDPEAVTSAASSRGIHAAPVEVVLRDREGTLLEIAGGEVDVLPEGIVRAEAGPIALGRGDSDGVDTERASLRLVRADDDELGWKLSELTIEHTRVRYAERDAESASPLWPRLRRHARQLRALIGAGDEPAEVEAEPDPPDAEERPGSLAPDAPDPPGEGEDAPAEGAHGSSTSTLAATLRGLRELRPRLDPAATVRIEDLAVVSTTAGEEHGVLSDLTCDLRPGDGDAFRFEGHGRPGQGGRLSWDLAIDPSTLRAEGHVELARLPFVLLVPFLPRLPWYAPEEARVSGTLDIEGSGVGQAHVSGEAAVEDLALASDRIAPAPVRRIRVSVVGEADWIARERRLELADVRVGSGRAEVTLRGRLEWPEDHYLIDLSANLPATDCNAVVGAIPADLLGELASFSFTGRLGGQLAVRIDSRDLDALVLRVAIANGCQFQTVPNLADIRRFEAPFVHRVLEPDGTTFEMETGPGSLAWTPIGRISPFLIQAVLGHEDAGFFGHDGFSVASIRLALIRNLRAERYVYGASTITMQLVKNVFLHREKTLARKVQEVLLTWWLESAMDKAHILELYLNVIEYGPGVYGISAASEHYFGVHPEDLTPAQAAYLATILPNPPRYHVQWEEGQLPAAHRRRVERFLHTLESRGRFDAAAVQDGLTELETFHFYHPGDPVPLPRRPVGGTRPLPVEGIFARGWDETDEPDVDDDLQADDLQADDDDDDDGWE